MIVEALLNNPVMHVFVDILVESRKRKVHNRLTYTEVKPSEGKYTSVLCICVPPVSYVLLPGIVYSMNS